MASERSTVMRPVVDDLQRIFGKGLHAVVVYGRRQHGPTPSLALVQSLSMDDLQACAARVEAWRRAGAATPLFLTREEFRRSLDAFPIEYGAIIAHHSVVFGTDPFAGLTINRGDLRRACEVQVKSLLLHLREDYLEGGADAGHVDALVTQSAPGFDAVLRQLAALDGVDAESDTLLVDYAVTRVHLDAHLVSDLLALEDGEAAGIDTVRLFPKYLASMERLSAFVDAWRDA